MRETVNLFNMHEVIQRLPASKTFKHAATTCTLPYNKASNKTTFKWEASCPSSCPVNYFNKTVQPTQTHTLNYSGDNYVVSVLRHVARSTSLLVLYIKYAHTSVFS